MNTIDHFIYSSYRYEYNGEYNKGIWVIIGGLD